MLTISSRRLTFIGLVIAAIILMCALGTTQVTAAAAASVDDECTQAFMRCVSGCVSGDMNCVWNCSDRRNTCSLATTLTLESKKPIAAEVNVKIEVKECTDKYLRCVSGCVSGDMNCAYDCSDDRDECWAQHQPSSDDPNKPQPPSPYNEPKECTYAYTQCINVCYSDRMRCILDCDNERKQCWNRNQPKLVSSSSPLSASPTCLPACQARYESDVAACPNMCLFNPVCNTACALGAAQELTSCTSACWTGVSAAASAAASTPEAAAAIRNLRTRLFK